MKVFNQLVLASSVVSTAAFLNQPSKRFGLKTRTEQPPFFSYLSNLGGGELASTPQQNSGDLSATNDEVFKGRKLAPTGNAAQQQQRSFNGQAASDEKPGPASIITSTSNKVKVQGGSLKTWSFASPLIQRIHVVLKTEGRPLDADVSLWQGPDNTPCKMRIYVEDGATRPFSAVIETPRGPNTVQIRNTGQLEFPLDAHVLAEDGSQDSPLPAAKLNDLKGPPMTIQGGALRTYPFDPSVDSVQVLLKTDGRPLRSRIELLQGPNNNKQVVELYTEDGLDRPFFMVIETPGSGNVVRVVNSATVEFPLTAWVEPYSTGQASAPTEPVIGGDDGRGFGSGGFVRQW
ncbi:hypothetical protein MPSEU_000154700 [Mayamaea pseudoterrestris]|nr:hypothetical protein MPSEU_000154700 [Mayamaea pseudoterrestris]